MVRRTPRPAQGSRRARPAVVLMLALAVAAVLWLKPRPDPDATGRSPGGPGPLPLAVSHAVPRLVDVGADACVPCKLMAPILDELRQEYAGRLEVVFVDVWKDPDAGRSYGVYSIPTQIFYDPAGRELFRHAGYLSKEEILATWRKLGIDLEPPAGQVRP